MPTEFKPLPGSVAKPGKKEGQWGTTAPAEVEGNVTKVWIPGNHVEELEWLAQQGGIAECGEPLVYNAQYKSWSGKLPKLGQYGPNARFNGKGGGAQTVGPRETPPPSAPVSPRDAGRPGFGGYGGNRGFTGSPVPFDDLTTAACDAYVKFAGMAKMLFPDNPEVAAQAAASLTSTCIIAIKDNVAHLPGHDKQPESPTAPTAPSLTKVGSVYAEQLAEAASQEEVRTILNEIKADASVAGELEALTKLAFARMKAIAAKEG